MIFRIFISSVQREFSAERKALAAFIRSDAILSKFFEVFIFEEVPAQDRPAAGVYLDEVDNCDIYLGLHGGRTTQQITQQTTQQEGLRKDLAALTKAIADAIRRNPSISIGEIMQDFSLSRDGVNYHIRKLKVISGLRRTSPNQHGVWRWENKV